MPDNDTSYNSFVVGLSLASSTLSIFGSLIIFVTYMAIPEIQTFVRKLIVCLTFADFLTAAGYILGASNYAIYHNGNANICKIQSYITTYSSLVSFNLTAMTAFHIFTTVTNRTDFREGKRIALYNVISWIVPAVIIAVAGSQDVLGPGAQGTGPWCWIRNNTDTDTEMWQMVTGKGWEIACYLITTSLYVLLKLYLRLQQRHERFQLVHTTLREEDQNFLYVWFVFYIIRLWGTVRFLIPVFNSNIDNNRIYMKVLLHFQAFGDPAQAFCNCILFCFLDKTVRTRFCRICTTSVCRYKELRESTIGDDSGSNDQIDHTRERGPSVGSHSHSYGSTKDEDFSINSYKDDNEDARSFTRWLTPRESPASFTSSYSEN